MIIITGGDDQWSRRPTEHGAFSFLGYVCFYWCKTSITLDCVLLNSGFGSYLSWDDGVNSAHTAYPKNIYMWLYELGHFKSSKLPSLSTRIYNTITGCNNCKDKM